MYFPLYASNKWVEPLDKYLNDASLTDAAWFKYDDIIKAWRDADSVDGKPYGIPYDGEVTVQVYRKDLYDAKGLKPAETYDQLAANAKALNDPANRIYGLALRGFAGAGQNMYIYPSLPEGSAAVGEQAATSWKPPRRCAPGMSTRSAAAPAVRNWNWRIADAARPVAIHRCAFVGRSHHKPREPKVVGKIALRWSMARTANA
jgi:ABC-type glycerol-3-phosphate transport system substrate-binding protein